MTEHFSITGAKPRILSCSVKTAAEVTGLGKSTIWKMIGEGRIETVTIGRRRLVLYASLEQLVRKSS